VTLYPVITGQTGLDPIFQRTAQGMFEYAERALDVYNTVAAKMRQLTPSQFVQILRPAFKEDEKNAIAVGALLGAAVGELQAFLVIHLPALLGG
jgi:hypothetical protein